MATVERSGLLMNSQDMMYIWDRWNTHYSRVRFVQDTFWTGGFSWRIICARCGEYTDNTFKFIGTYSAYLCPECTALYDPKTGLIPEIPKDEQMWRLLRSIA